MVTQEQDKNILITGRYYWLKNGMALSEAKDFGLRRLSNSEILYFNEFRKREHLSYNCKIHSQEDDFFIFKIESSEKWIDIRQQKLTSSIRN